MSKVFRACLVALLGACSPIEVMPPMLGDFDGSPNVPPGGGIRGGDGGLVGDGGAAFLAAASNPKGIVVANGQVFFTSWASGAGDGTVSVVNTTGGAVTDLANGLNGPWALTVVNGTVFFTLVPPSGPGGMSSVPTASPGTVTPIDTTALAAVGIATDGTNVYYAVSNGSVGIESVPVTGGTPKQQFDFGGDIQPDALTMAGTDLYVATTGMQAAVLHASTTGGNLEALDALTPITFADVLASTGFVFATVDDIAPNGQILAYPRGTGSPSTVATGLDHPQRLALDGNNLYFTDPAGGNVWVKDLTTTNAPMVYVSGLSAPLPIAVADALYVGVSDSILRITKL